MCAPENGRLSPLSAYGPRGLRTVKATVNAILKQELSVPASLSAVRWVSRHPPRISLLTRHSAQTDSRLHNVAMLISTTRLVRRPRIAGLALTLLLTPTLVLAQDPWSGAA